MPRIAFEWRGRTMPAANRGEEALEHRWPIITIGLVSVIFVLFLITHRTMQEQRPHIAEVKTHLLILALRHPGLDMPAEVRDFVSHFSDLNPDKAALLQSDDRPFCDDWDERTRWVTNEYTLQEYMNALVVEYQALRADSFQERFAFVPAMPQSTSYLTAGFFEPDSRTLLAMMAVLFLSGLVLESAWGRIIYVTFFFGASAVAMQIQTWTQPYSIVPMVGASGALAVFMGAVVGRFPFRRVWVFGPVVRAIWFAPIAAALLVMFGRKDLSADYANLFFYSQPRQRWIALGAAFASGVIAAWIFRLLRVERDMPSVHLKVRHHSVSTPSTAEAARLVEQGRFSEAEGMLQNALRTNPWSIDALAGLAQLYWQKNDMTMYHEVMLKLSQAYLKERDSKSAWQSYEEYVNSGGSQVPVGHWGELCRIAEEQFLYERAVTECEKLSAAYPNTREALMADLRAAKICLKQLGRPERALKLFEAAYVSPVPHLDFEQTIQTGIRESKVAMSLAGSIPVMD